jgi:pimeloyl-ACP methyl ester carboxylesterase
MEEAITFCNAADERLVGILSVPGRPAATGVGVILLNTGLNYRIAWHRLNVKLARALCGEGYHVLRFDTHGIGDSEGDIPAGDVVAHHVAIERGLFMQDTLAAIDFFLNRTGLEKVVLMGLCGGALTAMYAALREKRVCGIVHIAGPVTIAAKEHSGYKHPWEARQLLSIYAGKFLDPRGWARFFAGRSSYQDIITAARTVAGSLSRRVLKRFRRRGQEAAPTRNSWIRLNSDYVTAFDSYCLSRRKILFIFAENDTATWEFDTMFRKRFLGDNGRFRTLCDVYVIDNANHIFSSENAQRELQRLILPWLREGGWSDHRVDLHHQLQHARAAAAVH